MAILSRRAALTATSVLASSLLVTVGARAAALFTPGDLVVSDSVFQGIASTIAVGQYLPNSNGAVAIANGIYPNVFTNSVPEGNCGITSPILLQDVAAPNQITATSAPTFSVTAATGITTSFPSNTTSR